jgi:uncharacterized protein (TIGR02145 family)
MRKLTTFISLALFLLVLDSCKKEEIPTVTTSEIINVTGTSASSGGVVTSEGTSKVFFRGICWGTQTNPTITDSKTTDGTGIGIFTSAMTSLDGGKTYFVKAYATNKIGTVYGEEISFTTLGQKPLPTSSSATNITTTGATFNGSVNPNYLSTNVSFEYGTTTSYGNSIAAQNPVTGNTNSIISVGVTGLISNTLYHFRIKAENQLGITYGYDMTFTTFGTITDFDGNEYPTVQIGTQVWMAKNLRVIHYNDGATIPYVTNNTTWASSTSGAYCMLQNTFNSILTYGALYNWYTVNTGKLCPTGWHVPTDMEWLALTAYLGGAGVAGGKMKETGTSHWYSPNTEADNSSGFSALGGSYIDYNGVFGSEKETAYWWSSTGVSELYAFGNKLFYNNAGISQGGGTAKLSGFSVRCMKNN